MTWLNEASHCRSCGAQYMYCRCVKGVMRSSDRPAPSDDPVYEIHGLAIFGQRIRSWAGWPDDVRETIREWNRSKGLSFSYAGTGRINGIKFFRCEDCNRLIEVRAADRCVLRGKSYCEDCLIALARGGAR